MWTTEQRQAHERRGLRYPSDLTDAEWALVEPFIPPARRGGRKRTVDVREGLNGIFHVLGTGCQWRALPKDLPPRSTGYDAGKKAEGKKRHILVDTLGLLLSAAVLPADIQDRDGAIPLLRAARRLFPFVEVIFADGAYRGETTAKAVAGTGRWRLEIVSRGGAEGFVPLAKRWIVERTFAWLGRCRRLAKDFENLAANALAFLCLGMIRLMLRRLARPSAA